MATSITSQVASALIAQGKTAVEAELARIESDVSTAVTKAKAEASTLAVALANKLDAHTAEAAEAAALLARAQSTAAPASPTAISAPAITLTKARTVGNALSAVKSWLSANGWKGYLVLGLGVLALHYMWEHKILI